jgi:hypothetical protein
MRMLSRTLIVIAVGAAATVGTLTAVAAATGATPAADQQQASVVEDFNYPGSDQILADDGVQLLSGDGHIMITDCPSGPDTVGLILVSTTNPVGSAHNGKVCFHVTGSTGHLSLKIPAVYSIRGDGLTPGQGHKLKAQLTTDAGQHIAVDVNPSGTTQVGIVANPPTDPTTLLQLDASS